MSGDEPPPDRQSHPVLRVLRGVIPDTIRRSYVIKFTVVLLIMGASVGAIGLTATEMVRQEGTTAVDEQIKGIVFQEGSVIEEWLQRNSLLMVQLSEIEAMGGDDPGGLEDRLQTKLNTLPEDFSNLHLVERAGDGFDVLASTSMARGEEIANTERSWLADGDVNANVTAQATGEVYIADTYAVKDGQFVGLVSRIRGESDRFLLADVSIFQVTTSFQGDSITRGAYSQVVDTETNMVMMDERGEETLQLYGTNRSVVEPIQAGGELPDPRAVVAYTDRPADPQIMNERYAVGVTPISGTDWVVAVHTPRSNAYEFAKGVSQYGLYATIVMVLLVGALGAVLGYSTSRSIDRLTHKTAEMREGNLAVELYTPRIDNIGRLYAGFADMRDALKAQIEEAESARKEAEVSRAEALELSNYLQEKAEEYSEIMQRCAAGDLTQRMETDGEEASMDRIAEEFNEMIEELEMTTGQLKSYVDEVESAGAEVEDSADTVRQASEEVADSVQTISDDAYDQKERLQDVSETIDDVAGQLEDLVADHDDVEFDDALERIREVATVLHETTELSESTMAETENVAGAAEEQAAELNEVSERANDLQRYAQPLREILNQFETEAEHEFVFSVGATSSTRPDDAGEAGGKDADADVDEPDADGEGATGRDDEP